MQDDFYDQGFIYKYYAITMVVCYLLGQWIMTQMIASDCGYSAMLTGFSIPIPFTDVRIYSPLAHTAWNHDPTLVKMIPHVLKSHVGWLWLMILVGAVVCYGIHQKYARLSSHGTAEFAKAKDIKEMGLSPKKSGVVCGANPFDDSLLLDDGPAHVFLAAPTRTGKGVGIIIPTGIIWQHSMFFFDPKAELWVATAGYRKKVLHQNVLKFEPLCKDGSSASWNPYAEINFQSFEEMNDVKTINETMVKTGEGGGNKDPFWDNSAITLLNGVVLHLLYKNCQEKRELPCPTDAMSFISSPTMDTDHLYSSMKLYPHISPEDFMELPFYEEETDKDGKTVYKKDKEGNKIPLKDEEGNILRHRNPLKEIYEVYVADLHPFVNALEELHQNKKGEPLPQEEIDSVLSVPEEDPGKKAKIAFENLRQLIVKYNEQLSLDWKAPDITFCSDKQQIDQVIAGCKKNVFYQLLVHPKVAECAANIVNNAKETRESIIGSAKTALSLYQDPLIKRNTKVSDFCFKDLLDPRQAVSLYLVLQPNDVEKLRPLTRLFVNTMLAKTVRDMKFDVPASKKQRLLLMLDEFPQLKKMEQIENTLAICAGYGVKICTVVQSITQINQIYTKDNSILDNSQIQIYMTPSNIQQAKELSDIMGDKTIVEHNESGKGFTDKSTSESKISRKLMNPDEIMRMSKKKELVMVQGQKPILAKKIQWFKVPFFQKRVYDPQHGGKGGVPNPKFSDICTEVRTYDQLFAVHAPEVADVLAQQKAVQQARMEAMEAQKEQEAKETPAAEPSEEEAKEEEAPTVEEKAEEEDTHAEQVEQQAEAAEEQSEVDSADVSEGQGSEESERDDGESRTAGEEAREVEQEIELEEEKAESAEDEAAEESQSQEHPDTSDEEENLEAQDWLAGFKNIKNGGQGNAGSKTGE